MDGLLPIGGSGLVALLHASVSQVESQQPFKMGSFQAFLMSKPQVLLNSLALDLVHEGSVFRLS